MVFTGRYSSQIRPVVILEVAQHDLPFEVLLQKKGCITSSVENEHEVQSNFSAKLLNVQART